LITREDQARGRVVPRRRFNRTEPWQGVLEEIAKIAKKTWPVREQSENIHEEGGVTCNLVLIFKSGLKNWAT
jgi:hypothetical protein